MQQLMFFGLLLLSASNGLTDQPRWGPKPPHLQRTFRQPDGCQVSPREPLLLLRTSQKKAKAARCSGWTGAVPIVVPSPDTLTYEADHAPVRGFGPSVSMPGVCLPGRVQGPNPDDSDLQPGIFECSVDRVPHGKFGQGSDRHRIPAGHEDKTFLRPSGKRVSCLLRARRNQRLGHYGGSKHLDQGKVQPDVSNQETCSPSTSDPRSDHDVQTYQPSLACSLCPRRSLACLSESHVLGLSEHLPGPDRQDQDSDTGHRCERTYRQGSSFSLDAVRWRHQMDRKRDCPVGRMRQAN